jgi:tetratricopeptide (TPR) repeat protein
MKTKNVIITFIAILLCVGLFVHRHRTVGDSTLCAPEQKINPEFYSKQCPSEHLFHTTKNNISNSFDRNLAEDNPEDNALGNYGQSLPAIGWEQQIYIDNYKESSLELIEYTLLHGSTLNIVLLLELGNRYKDDGNLDDFKSISNILMDKFPDNLEAFTGLAHFFSENGDVAYATSIFERSIVMNPDDLSFRYSFGDLLEIEGDYQGALSQYFKGVELNVNDPEGYFKIGEVYLKLGDMEKADIYLSRASQISPEFLELSQELKSRYFPIK